MNQTSPSMPARLAVAMLLLIATYSHAQESLTWDQVKSEFESENPALKADALSVDEMRAEEITAYLRPNPQFTAAADGTQIAPHDGVWQPFKGTDVVPTLSYLHEREHKRELRLQSAKEGTQIAESQHEDLNGRSNSRFVPPLSIHCRPRLFSTGAKQTWTITTTSSRSAANVSEQAILLRSISIGSNCCGCNTRPRSRPPS